MPSRASCGTRWNHGLYQGLQVVQVLNDMHYSISPELYKECCCPARTQRENIASSQLNFLRGGKLTPLLKACAKLQPPNCSSEHARVVVEKFVSVCKETQTRAYCRLDTPGWKCARVNEYHCAVVRSHSMSAVELYLTE